MQSSKKFVRTRDQAIFSYTKQFDGADSQRRQYSWSQRQKSKRLMQQVDPEHCLLLFVKHWSIFVKYHEKQMQNSMVYKRDRRNYSGTESNSTGNV